MKTIEELRSEFEETKLFKENPKLKGVTYIDFSGYFCNGYYCFYLNGAFAMFQELKK